MQKTESKTLQRGGLCLLFAREMYHYCMNNITGNMPVICSRSYLVHKSIPLIAPPWSVYNMQEFGEIDWIKKLTEISAQQLVEQSKIPVLLDSMDKNARSMDQDIKIMHQDLSQNLQSMHHDLLNLDKNITNGFNDLKLTMESNTNDLKSTLEKNTNDLKSTMESNTNDLKSKLDTTNTELARVGRGFDFVVEKYGEFGETLKAIQISMKEMQISMKEMQESTKDIKEIVTSTQSTMKFMIAIGVTTVGVLLGILATILIAFMQMR
ncbi:MAG TPA: hypothetical protein EYP22_07575 [Methanosarcinales archaeon]|nr:hypothetical protein [Methanosarcinales archaeon]